MNKLKGILIYIGVFLFIFLVYIFGILNEYWEKINKYKNVLNTIW